MPEHPRLERSVLMLTTDQHVDRRILLSADSLEAAGWVVTIIASPLNAPVDDDRRVVRIGSEASGSGHKGLMFFFYSRLRGRLFMNSPPVRWMKRLAWRYLISQETFYINLFSSLAFRYRPDIVVAHDLPVLPVAKQAADRCGARLVYDSHELFCEQEFSRYEKRCWANIEAKYIRSCNLVVTVNQSIADELKKRYGLDDVKVIYNAERSPGHIIRSKRFHDFFGLATDKKILLLQGGLAAHRNLEVLVDAMCHVQNDALVLVFLGEGPLLQKLNEMVKERALDDKVYFHPKVAQKELLSYTMSADAGVIPYRATCLNNYLCTPNKMFEFISAGLPILATDLPEIRKIIEKHRIGMLGNTDSAEMFAGMIDEFFSDEARLDEWKNNVAETRKAICWEKEGEKLAEIYERLNLKDRHLSGSEGQVSRP